MSAVSPILPSSSLNLNFGGVPTESNKPVGIKFPINVGSGNEGYEVPKTPLVDLTGVSSSAIKKSTISGMLSSILPDSMTEKGVSLKSQSKYKNTNS